MNDDEFRNILTISVRDGKVLLIENDNNELDPSLDPVLLKQTFSRGGKTCMKLGDLIIPYDFNFKLYITTTLPNPTYTPEVYIKVQVINFALSVR